MIIHVDLNSFFARVEQQTNPNLRNKPIGILGKGHKGARTCICAASPEAKKFGVKSGMSTWEARNVCPQIILVPPDYPKYLDVSRRFFAILERFSPWVEIFSIDEGFIQVDGDIETAYKVVTGIKTALRNEIGELITVSAGIAWGKTFAKLAGSLQKPDGCVALTRATWLKQIGSLPVTKFCGIGYKISHHLDTMGIKTITDIHRADAGILTARFGPSLGMRLWHMGQGVDTAPVIASQTLSAAKSMSHQITLDQDWSLGYLKPVCMKLATKVGRRLRRAHQKAARLHIALTTNGGQYITNHLQYFPPINSDIDLKEGIVQLWKAGSSSRWTMIRRVAVVASHLTHDRAQYLPMFPDLERRDHLTGALDQLRNRYGEEVVGWGSIHHTQVGNLRDWRGPNAILDR